MRVYLVQHGQSKSEEEDSQRRLTSQGIDEVRKIADFLGPLELGLDAVWHSNKARAEQTAELLAVAVSTRDRLAQRGGLGPKDRVAPIRQALEKAGGDVMIVGHLPFLGNLAALLVTGSEANEIVRFQFGCVVCIEQHEHGKWEIAWMITPALVHG